MHVLSLGTFEEYEVPYQIQLHSAQPTRYEVSSLVCQQHYRPELSQRLYGHSLVC